MNKKISILLSLLFLAVACVSIARNPALDSQTESISQQIQDINFQLSKAYLAKWKFKQGIGADDPTTDPMFKVNNEFKLDELNANILKLQNQKHSLSQQLSERLNFDDWTNAAPWIETHFLKNEFDRTEDIELKDLKNFEVGTQKYPFPMENHFFKNYRLKFVDRLPFKKETPEQSTTPDRGLQFRARLECNADIIHENGFLFFNWKRRSKSYEFDWYNANVNEQRPKVQISAEATECNFRFRPIEETEWKYELNLKSVDVIQPAFADLAKRLEVCPTPIFMGNSDPESFFWSADYNQLTCVNSFDRIDNLSNPIEAIQARSRNLTGSELPASVFKNPDPTLSIDFSKAPKFDIIYVSSLNFSADFFGTLLAKMLRYHADQGTQIRVIIPKVSTSEKSKQLLNWLADQRPNVKFQLYRFKLTEGEDGSVLDKFHRVTHTKVLVGYSANDPSVNFFITGGRNNRDSYYFQAPTNLGNWPWLINYAAKEEPFVYYRDMEVEIHGTNFIKSVLGQGLSLWHRDLDSQNFRSTNINAMATIASQKQMLELKNLEGTKPLIRHFMSLPFVDSYQLERFYVDMFDSAQSEIIMTTPYFRPTAAISDAIHRAKLRGVSIKVLTRIGLAGDGTPKIAEEVNKSGINRHLQDADIFEWTDNSILHAKLVVVDQKLSFIGSVNLNHRSFIHDVESGILVLNKDTAKMIRDEINGNFINHTKQVTKKLKVNAIDNILLDMAEDFF